MIDVEHPRFVKARYYYEGRKKPVELIIVHSVEAKELGTTAEAVANYFKNPPVKSSAHYCIDSDSFVQCVWDSNTAFHCKGANANGIGLEHAGYAKQTQDEWPDEYGVAMLDISAQIAAYLCKKFKIPVQRALFKSDSDPTVVFKGFCGHADVPGHGSHWDPGKGFPWDYYLSKVSSYLNNA